MSDEKENDEVKKTPTADDAVVKLAVRVLELEDALKRKDAEAMGCILAIIDGARTMAPRRGTTAKRALRVYADMSEKAAAAEFDGWEEFVQYVRKETDSTGKEVH